MASGPACDAVACASSRLISASGEDSPSGGAVQAERRLHTERLLALVARERLERRLARGLGRLAERIVGGAPALLFLRFAALGRAVSGGLAGGLAGLGALLVRALAVCLALRMISSSSTSKYRRLVRVRAGPRR